MVGQVLARVHEADHGGGAGHGGQHAAHGRPVRGGLLVHRGDGGFRAAPGGQVPARAQPAGTGPLGRSGAHAGSTRSAFLSCWVMRLSRATAATALYQTAWRHPVARRSMVIAPLAMISK